MPAGVLQRYRGWKPRFCRAHSARKAGAKRAGRPAFAREENLTLEAVLAKYREGPASGVVADGSAMPNPGPSIAAKSVFIACATMTAPRRARAR